MSRLVDQTTEEIDIASESAVERRVTEDDRDRRQDPEQVGMDQSDLSEVVVIGTDVFIELDEWPPAITVPTDRQPKHAMTVGKEVTPAILTHLLPLWNESVTHLLSPHNEEQGREQVSV